MFYIFDLDHTVIDSSHRQLTRADGSLDLAHWIENCSREKIFGDSLLPLADQMRDLIARGKNVVICTARVMSDADYDFLYAHGLYTPWILSRPMGSRLDDAELKRDYCVRLLRVRTSLGRALLALALCLMITLACSQCF